MHTALLAILLAVGADQPLMAAGRQPAMVVQAGYRMGGEGHGRCMHCYPAFGGCCGSGYYNYRRELDYPWNDPLPTAPYFFSYRGEPADQQTVSPSLKKVPTPTEPPQPSVWPKPTPASPSKPSNAT